MKQWYLAKTVQGLEPILAQELQQLGIEHVRIESRAVSFETDQAGLYRANLGLRTALRILLPLAQAQVSHQQDLYDLARQPNYADYFGLETSFAVFATVQKAPAFNHSGFVALKVKDAVVDQFREQFGQRPFIDKDQPQVGLHLHLYKEQASLFLDSTGDSLHRRGYRRGGHAAPLSEVLAAGLVQLTGWDGQSPLIDGMCGSGTLLTEAGLIARRQAPNLARSSFGFSYWRDFKPEVLARVKEELQNQIQELEADVRGWDLNPRAVEEARNNAANAGLEDIRLSQGDFFEKNPPPPKPKAQIIMNPPYGERLEADKDMAQFYRQVGDRLKKAYQGYRAWIFTANIKALKQLGLKPSQKFELYNAQLPAQFAAYDLY